MNRIAFILAFIGIAAIASAQADTAYRLIAAVKGDVVDFTVDNLDNVYVLTSTDQLKKYNANGDSVAVFNNVKKFGRVAMVDASNPLKILLYYKDFATIVILDRFLSVRNTIDLRKQNIVDVTAVALSYDNNIWLYDEAGSKLKKIDDAGKTLLETVDFRLLFGEAPQIVKIFDQDGSIYLYDPVQMVYVFDYYGALRNKVLITGWDNFKVTGKYIFGTANRALYRYGITNFRLDEEPLPAFLANAKKINFTSARLYALVPEELRIYTFH
jgi:glutaredoxin-related protein